MQPLTSNRLLYCLMWPVPWEKLIAWSPSAQPEFIFIWREPYWWNRSENENGIYLHRRSQILLTSNKEITYFLEHPYIVLLCSSHLLLCVWILSPKNRGQNRGRNTLIQRISPQKPQSKNIPYRNGLSWGNLSWGNLSWGNQREIRNLRQKGATSLTTQLIAAFPSLLNLTVASGVCLWRCMRSDSFLVEGRQPFFRCTTSRGR